MTTDHSTTRRVTVFDTTLRDGEQAPRNAMKPQDKLHLALSLESLGVDLIESGFPASSPAEEEATRLIAQHLTTARVVTFCRAVPGDIEVAVRSAGTRNHQVQILATSSELHLDRKRQITVGQSLREIAQAVSLARHLGLDDISVALEDSSRGTDDLLRAQIETALEHGATTIVLPDTSGCLTPEEYGSQTARARSWIPEPSKLLTHCHDDFGLAHANTLAGLAAGADGAQVTLGGVGERAGNAALEQLVATLAYKQDGLGLHTDIDASAMYEAYLDLLHIIDLEQPRNKPIFGAYAFGSAAGIHQSGILRDPATYEYVEPHQFGRERSLIIGRHSGRSVLRHILDTMGAALPEEQIDDLYRRHISERADGDCEDISMLRDRLASELAHAAAH